MTYKKGCSLERGPNLGGKNRPRPEMERRGLCVNQSECPENIFGEEKG